MKKHNRTKRLPKGFVSKKILLTDAEGKPDGRFVCVIVRQEPKAEPAEPVALEDTVEDGERPWPTMIDDDGNERPQPMMG